MVRRPAATRLKWVRFPPASFQACNVWFVLARGAVQASTVAVAQWQSNIGLKACRLRVRFPPALMLLIPCSDRGCTRSRSNVARLVAEWLGNKLKPCCPLPVRFRHRPRPNDMAVTMSKHTRGCLFEPKGVDGVIRSVDRFTPSGRTIQQRGMHALTPVDSAGVGLVSVGLPVLGRGVSNPPPSRPPSGKRVGGNGKNQANQGRTQTLTRSGSNGVPLAYT